MAKQLWNVNFSTLNVSNDRAFKAFGGKYTNSANLTDGVYTADGEGSTPSFSINAVDIDWNGAVCGSSTINNSGDLIKKIASLENALATLAQNVGTLVTIANG